MAIPFLLALPIGLLPDVARADGARRWTFGLEAGAGTMIHDFDHATFSADTPAISVQAHFGFRLVGPVALQASTGYGQFLRERRALPLASGTLGLRFEPHLGSRGFLRIDAAGGVYLPGTATRLGFDVGVGYEFRVAEWFSVGPYVRFAHVWAGREGVATDLQRYVPVTGQDTDSIHWWTVGVSFTLHRPRARQH